MFHKFEKHTDKYDEIIKLWNEGKGRKEICNYFNIGSSTLHRLLKRLNLENKDKKSVCLSIYEKSLLIGTILEDTHILKGSQYTSSVNFAHCINQKEYFDFKVNNLSKLGISYNKEHNYFDKRTNKSYKRWVFTSHSCIELKELRNIFYIENKKILPIEFLENNFNEISLAYLFMDDGSTHKHNTIISTQSFEKQELEDFTDLIKRKFGLNFYVQKNKTIRIRQSDVLTFKNIIKLEMQKIKCMHYKI